MSEKQQELRLLQNRLEELLLQVIDERFNVYISLFEIPDPSNEETNTDYYRGYYEGTHDAYTRFGEIVEEFNDNNRYKLR
jgi:hypothetical protein